MLTLSKILGKKAPEAESYRSFWKQYEKACLKGQLEADKVFELALQKRPWIEVEKIVSSNLGNENVVRSVFASLSLEIPEQRTVIKHIFYRGVPYDLDEETLMMIFNKDGYDGEIFLRSVNAIYRPSTALSFVHNVGYVVPISYLYDAFVKLPLRALYAQEANSTEAETVGEEIIRLVTAREGLDDMPENWVRHLLCEMRRKERKEDDDFSPPF